MPEDFTIISQAAGYIDRNYLHEVALEEVSNGIGVPHTKFQQIFRRWSNTEPQIFLKCLAKKNYRSALLDRNFLINERNSDYQQTFGNKHQVTITLQIIERNRALANRGLMVIRYQFLTTHFGRCVIGLTSDRICWFSFVDNDQSALQMIQQYFDGAKLVSACKAEESSIDSFLDKYKNPRNYRIPLSLFGSAFQIRVLSALLKIPMGSCASYGMIASDIGCARAARAVGKAIGTNPISYLIPCHRVIRNSGVIGGYRWNTSRKSIILAWECAQKPR